MIDTIYEMLVADGPIWKLVTSTGCLYILYYFYKVVHKPILVVGNGDFKELLSENLDVLKAHFYPTFWAFHAHFQTICRVLFKAKPFIPYRRETLITPDKGEISLDWFDNNEDNNQFQNANNRPTVIILPGITGCSDASYVRNIIMEAKSMGWRSLVFNNRGMGKTDLKTPRTFCACNGEDLECVLNHISEEIPDSPLLIFAVSLGGVIFTNYLVSRGSLKANVIGALLISVPWCSIGTTASLEKPVNWFLYNRFIVNRLKSTVTQNLEVFQKHVHELPYELEDVMAAKSIREFDEKFTTKAFGFSTWHEYYAESSLILKPFEKITLPMLFLNARDDPFAPVETIPLERIKECPNMALILTDYGGHIGFIEGLTVNKRSIVERLFQQYATCMLSEAMKK